MVCRLTLSCTPSAPPGPLLLLWWNVPAFESTWTTSTVSGLGVGIERGSLVFFHPLFNPLFWHKCSALFSSQAFPFCFSRVFSSLKNLPLAYQKLWLPKVLFLIWDQELILEVKKLNTDYFFHSMFQLSSFSFRFCGNWTKKREKKSTGICMLSCHSIYRMLHRSRLIVHMQHSYLFLFFTIWIIFKCTVQNCQIYLYCWATHLQDFFILQN